MATLQTRTTNLKDQRQHTRNSGSRDNSRLQSVPMTVTERDETKDSMVNEYTSVHNQETMVDDKLTIEFDNQDHFVDTIVQFKKTKVGVPQFRLAMCCNCCKSRMYWFSVSKITEQGSPALQSLAMQVQELYQEGIDIQSQKTNEQLDNEEEDAMMCTWDIEYDVKKPLQQYFTPQNG